LDGPKPRCWQNALSKVSRPLLPAPITQANCLPGTWRFQVSASPYGGACEVTLQAGWNATGFHSMKGCL
jgi:hypothetical protein